MTGFNEFIEKYSITEKDLDYVVYMKMYVPYYEMPKAEQFEMAFDYLTISAPKSNPTYDRCRYIMGEYWKTINRYNP